MLSYRAEKSRNPALLPVPNDASGPTAAVVVCRALAGLLALRLKRPIPPSQCAIASVARAGLTAYSCGGSTGFTPVSLFACESPRKNQSNTILMQKHEMVNIWCRASGSFVVHRPPKCRAPALCLHCKDIRPDPAPYPHAYPQIRSGEVRCGRIRSLKRGESSGSFPATKGRARICRGNIEPHLRAASASFPGDLSKAHRSG